MEAREACAYEVTGRPTAVLEAAQCWDHDSPALPGKAGDDLGLRPRDLPGRRRWVSTKVVRSSSMRDIGEDLQTPPRTPSKTRRSSSTPTNSTPPE
jgi:hypothetical protein